MLADLELLVNTESPSHDVEALTRSAQAVADVIERRLGVHAELDQLAGRPSRARSVRADVAPADRRPPRHGVPVGCAGGTAVRGPRWSGHRAGCVRHEGRHRAGHPRLVAARRSRRCRDADHLRRGGRLGRLRAPDRGTGAGLRGRAGAGAERRWRRLEDRPQGHRHVRSGGPRASRARRARTGEGDQLARRRGAADHPHRHVRRSRHGHHRDPDGCPSLARPTTSCRR